MMNDKYMYKLISGHQIWGMEYFCSWGKQPFPHCLGSASHSVPGCKQPPCQPWSVETIILSLLFMCHMCHARNLLFCLCLEQTPSMTLPQMLSQIDSLVLLQVTQQDKEWKFRRQEFYQWCGWRNLLQTFPLYAAINLHVVWTDKTH